MHRKIIFSATQQKRNTRVNVIIIMPEYHLAEQKDEILHRSGKYSVCNFYDDNNNFLRATFKRTSGNYIPGFSNWIKYILRVTSNILLLIKEDELQ